MTRGSWRQRWPRARVVEAIARNVRPFARAALAKAYESSDEYERLAAAVGLASLGDRKARAYAQAKTRDPQHRELARYLLKGWPRVRRPSFMGRIG